MLGIAARGYALLLHAYPRAFRARFGDQMAADFEAQCADALSDRDLVTFATWISHAGADLVWSASIARASTVVPATRRIVRDLRPNPGFAALSVIVVVALIVLLGKAFAAQQPVLVGHAAVYAWTMMLMVTGRPSLPERAPNSAWTAVQSVTRFAVVLTTIAMVAYWIAGGAVLSLDFRPFLLAAVTLSLATVFAAASRFLRLR